jgi:hypothetical protein
LAAIAAGPDPVCGQAASFQEGPLCHLEIIEVPAYQLGPDLGNGGFWVEDYIGGGMFDGLVSIGSCDGACVLDSLPDGPNVHCRAKAFKPVRIENHSYAGVTPWRVWVPSECGCGQGLDIGWFSLNPLADFSLDELVFGVLGHLGTGGQALRTALATLPDLDVAEREALVRSVIASTTLVFALAEAPEPLRQANSGQTPMTPDLKVALEEWIWRHASDAIVAALTSSSLSPSSQDLVMTRLQQRFPELFTF